MANLVPFTPERLPESEFFDTQARETLMSRMFKHDLPGFVLHHAGSDSEFAVRQIEPTLKALGMVSRHRTILHRVTKGDDPLHVDSAPDPAGEKISTVNLHYTRRGIGRVTLFNPAETFEFHFDKVTAGAAFRQGLLDSSLFRPTVYTTNLSPEDLLVFRAGGRKPLGHIFETKRRGLSSTRIAELHIAKFGAAKAA